MKSESAVDHAARAREELGFSRWWQVVAAAVMMALVSPYQYVYSSIQSPVAQGLGVSPEAIGLVFTLFVIFQAGSQTPIGWIRDRHGPRELTLVAGVLAGGGYLGLAYATAVWHVYLLYSVGAVGVGIVYTVAVNTALKWFPDRRGLTTGVGTMAFAGGSAIVVPYVRANATAAGYSQVLRNLGLVIGAGILVGALVLRDPPSDWLDDRPAADGGDEAAGSESEADADAAQSTHRRQFTWREMLGTWQFWVMYAMFVGVSAAGLMLTAQIVAFADALDLTPLTATASATVLPVAGGIGRLVVGDLSDRVDRERAMAASFVLCGLGVLGVVHFARQGASVPFLAAVVVATFFWSPQYTLFPSVVGDYYGREHSSANYALLYSGKMWGGVFGGAVVGWLVGVASWSTAFAVGGALALGAGVAALALSSPR
ncbi:OFA family MFS transporter [Halobaculum gomorrense]|uniref:MFS transporter, OFA family, oxalate/formate antiporter n=1 Tax=Halobaculum gomorrense TaxID=43928 RepID=A0A1M5V561_9EURY|nr:OFA family MFS transporter [Halobaculum gomorrense]SHH70382.1 MFS transporter, OFA family, oxalate/formate antiporter [Halobaculum gomorrense]